MILELILKILIIRLLFNPLHVVLKKEKETKTTGMVSIPINFAVFKKVKWNKKKQW